MLFGYGDTGTGLPFTPHQIYSEIQKFPWEQGKRGGAKIHVESRDRYPLQTHVILSCSLLSLSREIDNFDFWDVLGSKFLTNLAVK